MILESRRGMSNTPGPFRDGEGIGPKRVDIVVPKVVPQRGLGSDPPYPTMVQTLGESPFPGKSDSTHSSRSVPSPLSLLSTPSPCRPTSPPSRQWWYPTGHFPRPGQVLRTDGQKGVGRLNYGFVLCERTRDGLPSSGFIHRTSRPSVGP